MMRRMLVLAGVAAACGAHAQVNFAYGSPGGGTIVDNSTLNIDIVVSGTGLTVTSISQIVLAQITHTWVGDLRVSVTHMGSGTSVFLFHHPLGDGGATFGDSSNLGNAGNYWFKDNPALPSIEQEAALGGDAYFVRDGDYRPARQANAASTVPGANSVNESFAVFVGLPLDTTWRLSITDRAAGDTGAINQWQIYGTAVPEPASLAALGIGALALLRRRRK